MDNVLKYKAENNVLSEKFQNQISKSKKEAKLIRLAHKYLTPQFPAWYFNNK
jgi:hypothetical protein